MKTIRVPSTTPPAVFLTLLASAALCACGGGGSDPASSADASGLDDATVTAYAANATEIAADATNTADAAVLATQLVLTSAATTSPAAAGMPSALPLAASPLATANQSLACAGGGSVTLTISGGTPASVLNGKFDAGEVYQVSFAGCASSSGAATLNGAATLTILSATGDSSNGTLGVSMTATALSLGLPRGSASLTGSATRTTTVSTGSNGVTQWASHFVSPSLTLATRYNARSSSFVLSAVDVQRQATLSGGVLQSSSVSGTHTLTATVPNGTFGYTVATTGSASYAADGSPVAGQWTITLPSALIGVTIGSGNATLTLDRGKDGSIDRTIVVPLVQLGQSAG